MRALQLNLVNHLTYKPLFTLPSTDPAAVMRDLRLKLQEAQELNVALVIPPEHAAAVLNLLGMSFSEAIFAVGPDRA